MARNNDRDRDRGSKRVLKDNRPRGKKKICIFCKDHVTWVDYKDVNLLKRFMSDRGKIRSRRVTGNCAQHQRDVQVAIKTAREVALLPYTTRTVSERGPGRGPRPPRSEGAESQLPEGESPPSELADLDDLEDEDTEGSADLEEVEA
jgi:small subunit ribosomal protein S18